MPVLAEVRVILANKEARLMLLRAGEVVEDEIWSFRPAIERAGAGELSKAMFDDLYDFLNFATHGTE